MKTINVSSFLMVSVFMFVSVSVEAIPAFARKYDTKCSSCHSAYPQLNKAGRNFKEAGYAFPKIKGEVSLSDTLSWDEVMPLSVVVKSRPYDKKNSPAKAKLRALHEVEILIAGRFSDTVSGFVELESEDEAQGAFGLEIGLAHAALNVRFSKALNLHVAYAPLLFADSYDTYSGGRRLTRGKQAVIDQSFGGADNGGKLSGNRQTLSFSGRPASRFFYNVGISGNVEDGNDEPVGEDFGTFFARVAFDVTNNVMVGGLIVNGSCGVTQVNCPTTDRSFSRTGIDVQADIGNIRVMGAFITADDDNTAATGEASNDALYVLGQYTVKENGHPVVVGTLRLDDYDKSNGTQSFSAATVNLTYYFAQNMKGFVEFWDQTDAPTAAGKKKNRLTFQAEVAF